MKLLASQISIFGDLHDIAPSNEYFAKFSKSLPSFLPATQQILNVEVGSGIAKFEPRMSLINNEERARIDFQTERIDVVLAPVQNFSQDEISKKIDTEIEYAITVYSEIFKEKQKNAKRLAISLQLVEQEGSEKPDYNQYISCGKNEELFEWSAMKNTRSTIEFGGTTEDINQLVQYSLGTANSAREPKFAVLKLLDVNTVPEKIEERFDLKKIEGYLKAIKIKVLEMLETETTQK